MQAPVSNGEKIDIGFETSDPAACSQAVATSLLSGYHNYFDLMALLTFCTMIPALLNRTPWHWYT
jgi:hypothetical protein